MCQRAIPCSALHISTSNAIGWSQTHSISTTEVLLIKAPGERVNWRGLPGFHSEQYLHYVIFIVSGREYEFEAYVVTTWSINRLSDNYMMILVSLFAEKLGINDTAYTISQSFSICQINTWYANQNSDTCARTMGPRSPVTISRTDCGHRWKYLCGLTSS